MGAGGGAYSVGRGGGITIVAGGSANILADWASALRSAGGKGVPSLVQKLSSSSSKVVLQVGQRFILFLKDDGPSSIVNCLVLN